MRTLRAVIFLIGFTSVTAQVVLMRELLVLFSGAEISLGFMLASWLLWTAAGSGLAGKIRPGRIPPRRLTAVLVIVFAVMLPATILAARFAKSALQTVPGEIQGPGFIFAVSMAALAPVCILGGWLFAAASALWREEAGARTAEATRSVYLIEALGWAAGGLVSGLVLLPHAGPLPISFVLAALNLCAAACLLARRRAARLTAAALIAAVFGVWLIPIAAPSLEKISLARLWRPFDLVATANSIYGNLVLASHEGGTTLYENGLAVATVPDLQAAEEAVHYALLQHPAPEAVLLIGGGVNGSLTEVLKHRGVKRLDYVELDPEILNLARTHFPEAARDDPRVRAHAMDGRRYLKTVRDSYDVIIAGLPDPETAQLNRFYTVEFFREAASRLRPGGVFSFRVTASENYISPELAAFLRCLHRTLRDVFPEVSFLPGSSVHFFASKTGGVLLSRPGQLVERLQARAIETSYVREYYLPFRMAPDRMEQLAAAIAPRADTPVNRDLAPVAYYFGSVLWSARVGRAASRWLVRLEQVGFGRTFALAGLAGLVLVWLMRKPRPAAGFSVATMGFAMIGLEILLLLGFQAVHGYVYHQLALLVAMFMAGMAAGSWRSKDGAGGWRRLALLQALAAVAPLVLCLLMGRGLSAPLFALLAFLSGLLGGHQFPLASRLFFGAEREGGAGTLYALDLAGSCVGAVLISAWFIPLFGFWRAGAVISVLCLASSLPSLLCALRAPTR
ncbi:MAG: fused MFS/spermidine synthase [Bryobacteraceae bacterium]